MYTHRNRYAYLLRQPGLFGESELVMQNRFLCDYLVYGHGHKRKYWKSCLQMHGLQAFGGSDVISRGPRSWFCWCRDKSYYYSPWTDKKEKWETDESMNFPLTITAMSWILGIWTVLKVSHQHSACIHTNYKRGKGREKWSDRMEEVSYSRDLQLSS